jgi:hypothetical protein
MLSVPSEVKARAQADSSAQGLTVSAYISRLVLRKKFQPVSLALALSPLIDLGHRVVTRLDTNGSLSDTDRKELIALRREIADAIAAATVIERNGRP